MKKKLSKVLGLYTFPFKISLNIAVIKVSLNIAVINVSLNIAVIKVFLNIAVIKVFLYLTEKMHHYYILVSYYLKHFNDNNNC